MTRIARIKKIILSSLLFLFAAAAVFILLQYCSLLKQRRERDENAYDHIILEKAKQHNLSPYLIKAVIKQESGFNPLAVGNAGERGLMQIMDGAVSDWEEGTGRKCLHRGLLFSPRLNIEIGSWYLGRAVNRWREYKDREAMALTEYNAGPSRARDWAPDDKNASFLPRVAFESTRNYIKNVLKYKEKLTLENKHEAE